MSKKRSAKPSAAIGHVVLRTPILSKTFKFYLDLGLRKVWQSKTMGILELRGGTHILFFRTSAKPKKPPKAKFDLMVDDVPLFHKNLKRQGKRVSAVRRDSVSGHDRFSVTDPDGRVVSIYSSHTEGRNV